MRIIKSLLRMFSIIRSLFWCITHGVKYKKGVYIGRHVKKNYHVKLELSNYSRICDNVMLWGNGPIKIGSYTSIGPESRLYASEGYGIEIGDYVNSASHLYIIDSNHGMKKGRMMLYQPMSHKKIRIGNDIWFGYHVTVLPGVKLEDGIVCGACSVITKAFPSNAIICGNPAKIVKYREY